MKKATSPIAGKSSPPEVFKKEKRRLRRAGTHTIWPAGVQEMLGVSNVTRWRMERDKKLPARDVYLDGKAVGWRITTILAALAGRVDA